MEQSEFLQKNIIQNQYIEHLNQKLEATEFK